MPPVGPLIPHLSQSLRHSNTPYRRDSVLRNGPLVSFVITVIILSILVAGATLYLARLLWAKLGSRGCGRGRGRGGPSSSSQKEFESDFGESKRAAVSQMEHQPWISKSSSGKDSDYDNAAAAALKEMEHVWEPQRDGGEVHNRKAKGKMNKIGRVRSYSDELWSAQVVDHLDGSDDDDDDDDSGEGGLGGGKPKANSGNGGKGSSRGGLARHSSSKARRSRFMSVGGAPAAGFKPLGMHPVREDDLVDVPPRGPTTTAMEERGGPRGSWPLRSHVQAVPDEGSAAKG